MFQVSTARRHPDDVNARNQQRENEPKQQQQNVRLLSLGLPHIYISLMNDHIVHHIHIYVYINTTFKLEFD